MPSVIIRPNGAGALTECSKVGAASNWQAVDEAVANGDIDYILSAFPATCRDRYALENVSGHTETINYVRLHFNACKATAAGVAYCTPVIRLLSSESSGTQISLSRTYTGYYYDFATKPTGGTFTWANINDLQAGVTLQGVSTGAKCTQVYLEVFYTPAATDYTVAPDAFSYELAFQDIDSVEYLPLPLVRMGVDAQVALEKPINVHMQTSVDVDAQSAVQLPIDSALQMSVDVDAQIPETVALTLELFNNES